LRTDWGGSCILTLPINTTVGGTRREHEHLGHAKSVTSLYPQRVHGVIVIFGIQDLSSQSRGIVSVKRHRGDLSVEDLRYDLRVIAVFPIHRQYHTPLATLITSSSKCSPLKCVNTSGSFFLLPSTAESLFSLAATPIIKSSSKA